MKICGIEKFSLVDWDGKVSCTLFLQGCNFRCPFCHNSSLVVNPNDPEITLEEVDEYLSKRKGVIDAVVVSGGEPTINADLKDLIIHLRDFGVKIKLDTNGTNPKMLKELIEEGLIDYCAMDIKNSFTNYSLSTHITFNIDKIKENVKESINILMNSSIDYEFRTTLVLEEHSENDIKEIGQMIKGCKKYFLQKFVDKGSCIEENLHEVEEKKTKEYLEILKDTIPNVSLRGY